MIVIFVFIVVVVVVVFVVVISMGVTVVIVLLAFCLSARRAEFAVISHANHASLMRKVWKFNRSSQMSTYWEETFTIRG